MYVNEYGTGVYACPSLIPVGTHLVRVDSSAYGDNRDSYKMMYGSYVGFIKLNRLTEEQ